MILRQLPSNPNDFKQQRNHETVESEPKSRMLCLAEVLVKGWTDVDNVAVVFLLKCLYI